MQSQRKGESGAYSKVNPSVSVVIATHNRPELLQQALAAALSQEYDGDVEVLVVFDRAEPDLTLTSARPGRTVQVLENSEAPGLAGARNTGIKASRGSFVAFCDDDDEWLASKLASQVALAQEQHADTVVTGITICYDDRETARVPRPADLSLEQLARRRVMEAHPSSVLVRRTALADHIGLVDEKIPGSYGEDFDWILRAAQHGPIAVVEEPLVRVRWGQSLFSTRWQTIADAIDYLIEKHAVLSEYPDGLARLRGRRAFALAALGQGPDARREAGTALRLNKAERRAYLAIAVSTRLVPAETILSAAHKRGRGI